MKIQYGEHKLVREPVKFDIDVASAKLGGEDITPEFRSILTKYLSHFDAPNFTEGKDNTTCIKCGSVHTGLFGTFTWGIMHGAGNCSKCGWPATAYHFVKDEKGVEHRITMILQAHPDDVEKRKK